MGFRNILSINVVELNLVGCSTNGVKKCDVRLLTNRLVSSSVSIFKRSMLKSPIKADVLSSEAILSSRDHVVSVFYSRLL